MKIKKRNLSADGLQYEIEKIIRVAKTNPLGLRDFLMVNFPIEWGLDSLQHAEQVYHADKIKIESDIKMPKNPKSLRGNRKSGLTAALKTMEKGQSFTYPIEKRASIYAIARQSKIKIVIVKIDDITLRVWRK